MNTCAICEYRSNNLTLNLDPSTRDNRLPFVKRVLDLLIESRFGPGSTAEPLPEISIAHRERPAINLDLHPQRFYDEPASDALRIAIAASLVSVPPAIAGGVADLPRRPLAASPSNLGRGSPKPPINE